MRIGCYRQGDVFLIPVKQLPPPSKRQGHREVLAEGEVTGHAHRFTVPGETEVFTVKGQMYVEVLAEAATLAHEEHGPIALPRGGYLVRIQREYTPQGIQRVYD